MKKVLSGDEAVARGAWEAGCHFAAAYPGTPSTEILENCATYDEIDAQWSVNEKTAFEVAAGAAFGGARALVAMKHVGLNVAADPLFTLSYTGISGGFVAVSADDPGMHSSQNEQDNRHYARAAKLPCLEPSDSQESKDLVVQGFELSEKFNTPVLFRMTTRICHSKSVVELCPRAEVPVKPFERTSRFLVLPAVARKLHVEVEKRTLALEAFGGTFPWNRAEYQDLAVGVVTSGVSYQYAREAFPEASFLKLGLTWPLPKELVREFAGRVKKLLVIEEGEAFLEDQLKAMGLKCEGKKYFGLQGELSPERVLEGLELALPKRFKKAKTKKEKTGTTAAVVPERPPVLCPGCPHRGVFHALGKMKVFVSGDIGCYTLGALPPQSALHSCLCMGGGVTVAEGIEKARKDSTQVVGMVGDSTFFHSGITGLIDMVYNRSTGTLLILDNSITGMTGHQDNPGTGKTLKGQPTTKVSLEAVVRGCGVTNVRVVDPYDLKATEQVLREEVARPELSVVITRRPCILIDKERKITSRLHWLEAKCVGCGMCLKIGCPALERQAKNPKQPLVNETLCVHCGMCAQVCKVGAMKMEDR